jgi:hypothetical protein
LFACHFLAKFTTGVSQKTLCKISLKSEKNIWGYNDPCKSFSFGDFWKILPKRQGSWIVITSFSSLFFSPMFKYNFLYNFFCYSRPISEK